MVTLQSNSVSGQLPVAKITKLKNQLKSYNNDSTIFLNNGDEFEIMLYNPRQEKYLAKIQINGKNIFESGLIIKPGQRIYLERFFDGPKKFKFETYNVEGDSLEIKEAIKNNGNVKVEFYKEKLVSYNNFSTVLCKYNLTNTPNTSGGIMYNTLTSNTNLTTGTNVNFIGNTNATFTAPTAPLLETGRIEKGGESKQEFVNEYSNFEYYCSASSIYKILPISQKPVEFSEIRNYCSNCGTKIKTDNWKFCPKCGTKVV